MNKFSRGLRITRSINDVEEFRNSHKRKSWRVSVNGKGMAFIPPEPMSRSEAARAIRLRFGDCDIDVSK